MAVPILCRTPFSNSPFMSVIDKSAFSCCYCCWFEIISDVFLGGWTVRFIAQLKHTHTHYKMCSSYTNINFVYMDQISIPPFVNAFFTLFSDQSDTTLILTGRDFNLLLNPEIDRHSRAMSRRKTLQTFLNNTYMTLVLAMLGVIWLWGFSLYVLP